MKLFNTLSRKIEIFQPLKNKTVTLYICGPTVYDYAHIGNLRTFIFGDVLRRTLEFLDYNVKQVMNITDIDDKTIAKSEGKKDKFTNLTKKFEEAFWQDLEKLNIKKPTKTPRATEYIKQMLLFIQELMKKGYAYKSKDGSIYFSIEKFADYGKLSNLDKSGIKSGIRISQDQYSKENPADFVLWKVWDEKDGEIFWDPSTLLDSDTKIEKGRPGWHIECSTMSQDKLGETIDIHIGGVDLIFPHHENEIAQSEARSGKKFVNFWLHTEHLLVDGKKMAKSLNNFYTLADLAQKGFNPLDFRYLCLSAHWRDKLNFTWQSLEAAKNTLARARKIINDYSRPDRGSINSEYLDKFKSALENDLNIPTTLSVFWQMLRDEKISIGDKKITAIEMDKVFALDLDKMPITEIPEAVKKLVSERRNARKEKNFQLADKLRDQIDKSGYILEDFEEGSKIYKK